MKKFFLFLILSFLLFYGAEAKIDSYKKGDQVSGQIKLSNKRSIILPNVNGRFIIGLQNMLQI